MEVGEDGVSNGVVVGERESELSFCRFEDVGRRVLRVTPSAEALRPSERTYLVSEFGLTSSSKHREQFEHDFDDASFAQQRREARNEVVEVSSRDRSNPTILMSALKQDLSNLAIDGFADRMSCDEVAESSYESSVDLMIR